MAKKKKNIELLTKKQRKELTTMANEMLDIAANVVREYEDLDLSELSELSSSLTQINENSPFLDEIFKGDSWKRVIKNISKIPKEDKEDDTEWVNKRNSKESNGFNLI